jgi:hypothetical protein
MARNAQRLQIRDAVSRPKYAVKLATVTAHQRAPHVPVSGNDGGRTFSKSTTAVLLLPAIGEEKGVFVGVWSGRAGTAGALRNLTIQYQR